MGYSDESECPHDSASLREDLSDLMARGVIEAGFELSCHRCGSVSWLPLARAVQHGECIECGTPWSATAEMPWFYRLAPLARRAFQRSGGAMPVLLAVHRLHLESRGSFLWHPNLNIYRPDHAAGQRPWHELDIVSLVDGEFAVGEVKDDIAQFVASDFKDLREVCESIQPDAAHLVFLEGEFDPTKAFAEYFEELRTQLEMRTKVEWHKLPSRW